MSVSLKCKMKKKAKKPPKKIIRHSTDTVSRCARMLALAYFIERLVASGDLKDYAEAAMKLGISRARISQIMNLINLPVYIQEDLLTGKLHISERNLRSVIHPEEPWQLRRET